VGEVKQKKNRNVLYVLLVMVLLFITVFGITYFKISQRVVAFSISPKPYVVLWQGNKDDLPFTIENTNVLTSIIQDLDIDKPVVLDFEYDPDLANFASLDMFLADYTFPAQINTRTLACMNREERSGGGYYYVKYLIKPEAYKSISYDEASVKMNKAILYCLVSIPNGPAFVEGKTKAYLDLVNTASNKGVMKVFKLKQWE